MPAGQSVTFRYRFYFHRATNGRPKWLSEGTAIISKPGETANR